MTPELQTLLIGIAIGVVIVLVGQWAAAANVRRTDRVRRDREQALMARRTVNGWGSVEELARRRSTILGEVAAMNGAMGGGVIVEAARGAFAGPDPDE